MLWNEPNNLSHWDRTLDPDWARFAEMVGLAAERLGNGAPGLTRVLGGVGAVGPWCRALDPDWALFAEMVGLAAERLGNVAPGLTRVLGGISPIDPQFLR